MSLTSYSQADAFEINLFYYMFQQLLFIVLIMYVLVNCVTVWINCELFFHLAVNEHLKLFPDSDFNGLL